MDEQFCGAKRVWAASPYGEIHLRCDLLASHSVPRHRTTVDETIVVYWEKRP